MSKETPWRNGFWSNAEMPSMVCVVDGNEMSMKYLIALDYPDLEGGMDSTIEFGDFGPTNKEMAEATGADRYNVQLTFFVTYKVQGVLNEAGTEIQQWQEPTKSVEVLKWLTPEKVEEMKEDRDDVNAPR